MFVLSNFLVAMLLGVVFGLVAGITGYSEIAFAGSLLYYLATLTPWLAASVRRLHDTNRSAWWLLIFLVQSRIYLDADYELSPKHQTES